MKMIKATGVLAVATVAFLLAGQVFAESQVTSLEDLEGWWRFDDPELAWGCEDQDNQYRVAIGRWEYDENAGQIRFGVGEEQQLGFYDGACKLLKGKFKNGEFTYRSECFAGGDDVTGKTIINPISQNVIKVQTPIGPSMVLIRCPPQQAKQEESGQESLDSPTEAMLELGETFVEGLRQLGDGAKLQEDMNKMLHGESTDTESLDQFFRNVQKFEQGNQDAQKRLQNALGVSDEEMEATRRERICRDACLSDIQSCNSMCGSPTNYNCRNACRSAMESCQTRCKLYR